MRASPHFPDGSTCQLPSSVRTSRATAAFASPFTKKLRSQLEGLAAPRPSSCVFSTTPHRACGGAARPRGSLCRPGSPLSPHHAGPRVREQNCPSSGPPAPALRRGVSSRGGQAVACGCVFTRASSTSQAACTRCRRPRPATALQAGATVTTWLYPRQAEQRGRDLPKRPHGSSEEPASQRPLDCPRRHRLGLCSGRGITRGGARQGAGPRATPSGQDLDCGAGARRWL